MAIGAIWDFMVEKPELLAAILTVILTAIWQLFTVVITPRAKVIWGVTSDTIFGVPYYPSPTEEIPQPQMRKNYFYTRNVWIWNNGSAAAEDLQVSFNWKPEHIDWFPYFKIEETHLTNGRYMISLAQLNPKTGMNIAMLSANNELPDITGMWHNGRNAKRIQFLNQRRFPTWVNVVVALIMLLGIAAAVYLMILLIQFFV